MAVPSQPEVAGFPLGTDDAKALSYNAASADYIFNSTAYTWLNRLGQTRQTMAGHDKTIADTLDAFQVVTDNLIYSVGFINVGLFSVPDPVNSVQDTLTFNSEEYAVTGVSFPYTPSTTDPSTDAANWRNVTLEDRKTVARVFGVKDIEVIYHDDTATVLDNIKIIFDKSANQKAWRKPINVGAGETIASVVEEQLETNLSTYTMYDNLLIGDGEYHNTEAQRDGIYVRRILNDLSDCHGVADKTLIEDVVDAGTYGVFDAQTEVGGSHNQSHLFILQDRTVFSGSGLLGSWGNIMWPTKTGAGNVTTRYDLWVKDINNTGGGTVASHIGIFFEDLSEATSNVAVNIQQSTGFTMFAPNGGQWDIGGKAMHRKEASFGGQTYIAGAPVTFAGVDVVGAVKGFLSSSLTSVNLGVVGDFSFGAVVNGANRLLVQDSASGYAVTPGVTGTQNLGEPGLSWKEIFADNDVINISDETFKTKGQLLSDAELDAWSEIPIVKFKFLAAIEEKGNSARWHVGRMAQEIERVFKRHGLDAFDYSVLCFDKWPESVIGYPEITESHDVVEMRECVDPKTNEVSMQPVIVDTVVTVIHKARIETIPAGERYGVRSSEAAHWDSALERRDRKRIEERLLKAGF